MPKLKTHKGIKKRFKVSATGKVSHKRAGSSHLNSHKSGKRVRYICPHGDMKAWAKHGARLVCGEHMEPMEVNLPTPRGYRDITPTAEEADSEEPASEA